MFTHARRFLALAAPAALLWFVLSPADPPEATAAPVADLLFLQELAAAQSTRPVNSVNACAITVTSTPTSLKDLFIRHCGPHQIAGSKGRAGLKLGTLGTTRICVGGADVIDSVTPGGRDAAHGSCYPIAAGGVNGIEPSMPIGGGLDATYAVTATTATAFIIVAGRPDM